LKRYGRKRLVIVHEQADLCQVPNCLDKRLVTPFLIE